MSSIGNVQQPGQVYTASQISGQQQACSASGFSADADDTEAPPANALAGSTTASLSSQTMGALIELSQTGSSSQSSAAGSASKAHHHHHGGGKPQQPDISDSTATAADPSIAETASDADSTDSDTLQTALG